MHYGRRAVAHGRVLDSRLKASCFKPHRRHCVVSLSKNINPSLVLGQPRKTRPYITENLLIGRKESNQNKKNLMHYCTLQKKLLPFSAVGILMHYNCTQHQVINCAKG